MTLRVTTVANPAPGTDWRYVIPAQDVVQLQAVFATLASAQNPTIATDASPNANNLTYNATRPGLTFGVTGPFGGGGGSALQVVSAGTETEVAIGTNAGQYDVATVTFEALVNATTPGLTGFQELITQRNDGQPLLTLRWIFGIDNAAPCKIRVAASQFDVFSLAGTFARNAWHHIAVTYDGAQWVPYIDGVAGAATAGHAPTTALTLLPLTIIGERIAVQQYNGKCAALAMFSGALSGAQIAAHFAAVATSSAAYRTAVLADSPIALWMLADPQNTSARAAALAITDGTNTVGNYPGITSTATTSPYTWTWATNAPGTNIDATGRTNYVQIPAMTLPGGYTIGTSTPGIGGNDQWSNITLWWDDALSGAPGRFAPAPYLDAYLVPDFRKAT